MTVEDLKQMDCAVITPNMAAKVIGCDPHYIRVAAKTRPEMLGFPTIQIGSRVKIPRLALIHILEGGGTVSQDAHEG